VVVPKDVEQVVKADHRRIESHFDNFACPV
jgi:hypothetical protein